MKIANSILDCIGNTPLLRLNKVAGGPAAVLAKCEFLNPSGSIKDRIALRMVEEAERAGKLKKGGTIADFSSGNTGPALAMVAAVKGYKLRVFLPEFFDSKDRNLIMKLFGGRNIEFVRYAAPKAFQAGLPKAWKKFGMMYGTKLVNDYVGSAPNAAAILQFFNPFNVAAHRETTGREILEQTGGKVDAWVASVGTGGTLLGVAQALKKRNPKVRVVAVEPEDTHAFELSSCSRETVELYVKYCQPRAKMIINEMVDAGIVDEVVKVKDRDARAMADRLCQEEGAFCGMSSGANVFAAARLAAKMRKGANVVTVLVDRRDRYFSEHPDERYIV